MKQELDFQNKKDLLQTGSWRGGIIGSGTSNLLTLWLEAWELNVLSEFTVLCWATFLAILKHMQPASCGSDMSGRLSVRWNMRRTVELVISWQAFEQMPPVSWRSLEHRHQTQVSMLDVCDDHRALAQLTGVLCVLEKWALGYLMSS